MCMYFYMCCLCIFCVQGVGGTVQLPRGYLKRAYETIRANGGVCISDEVSLSYIVYYATACKH